MTRTWKTMLGVGGALLTLLPLSAQAGADGRKNTAIVLGAAAAFELLKGKTTEAIALGAGAAYAGKRYEDARKTERSRNNRRYYDPYGSNSDPYYSNDQDYESYNGRSTRPDTNRQYPYRSGQRADAYQQWRGDGKHGLKRGWNGRSLPPGQYKKIQRGRGSNDRD